MLAVVLTTQAALIAAVTNSDGDEKWSNLLWLGFYFLLIFVKKVFAMAIKSGNILSKQPASIQILEPLNFLGRRTALVFISMLPVSHRVDRWSWWNVFMPDNERRRAFHARLENSPIFMAATNWQQSPDDGFVTKTTEANSPLPEDGMLEESAAVRNSTRCLASMDAYLDVVFPLKNVYLQTHQCEIRWTGSVAEE